MKITQLTLIALTVLLAACVGKNGNQSSSVTAVESSVAAISSEAMSSEAVSSETVSSAQAESSMEAVSSEAEISSAMEVSSSSIAESSSSEIIVMASSSEAVSSSSMPASSSSKAASSSSAAPVYEFDRNAGKTTWQNSNCAACHGASANQAQLSSTDSYSHIVNYLNTGSPRTMPIGGTACKNQCAKNVASYIVYDIYRKPLPNLQKPSIGINDILAINAGSGEEVDSDGVVYAADVYFEGGSTLTTSDAISGSGNGAVQSARIGSFNYAIPIANGFYVVELGMTELYYQAEGERVFSVNVENQMMNNIDLVKTAGHDVYAPLTFGHVEVTDGVLNIDITAGEGVLNLITVKESLE